MITIRLTEQQATAVFTAAQHGTDALTGRQVEDCQQACEVIWKALFKNIDTDRRINAA